VSLAVAAGVDASGWSGLFTTAFRQSRNAMALVDEERRHVDVNGAYLKLLGRRSDELIGRPIWEVVVGGPVLSEQEWAQALVTRQFTGRTEMRCRDGTEVEVQWGAATEVVTGGLLVLFVALSMTPRRLGFRPDAAAEAVPRALSKREREVVRFVALGYTGPEIAAELHLSHDTVRTHVRNAMVKVGARSRAQLVAKALGNGAALA
jgi:PAS domain S-box-containing protein